MKMDVANAAMWMQRSYVHSAMQISRVFRSRFRMLEGMGSKNQYYESVEWRVIEVQRIVTTRFDCNCNLHQVTLSVWVRATNGRKANKRCNAAKRFLWANVHRISNRCMLEARLAMIQVCNFTDTRKDDFAKTILKRRVMVGSVVLHCDGVCMCRPRKQFTRAWYSPTELMLIQQRQEVKWWIFRPLLHKHTICITDIHIYHTHQTTLHEMSVHCNVLWCKIQVSSHKVGSPMLCTNEKP